MFSERGQQKTNAITPDDEGNTTKASAVHEFIPIPTNFTSSDHKNPVGFDPRKEPKLGFSSTQLNLTQAETPTSEDIEEPGISDFKLSEVGWVYLENCPIAHRIMAPTWKEGQPKIGVGLDWVTLLFRTDNEDDFRALQSCFLGHSLIFPEHEGKFYVSEWTQWFPNRWTDGKGTTMLWDKVEGEYMGVLRLTGKWFAGKTFREYLHLLMYWSDIVAMEPTRSDLRVDDHTKKLMPVAEMYRAIHRGDNAIFQNFKDRTEWKNGNSQGLSWLIGSDKSDAFTRVYDKGIESKGVSNLLRWETELHQDKAREFWRGLKIAYTESYVKHFQLEKSKNEIKEQIAEDCRMYITGRALATADFIDRSTISSNGSTKKCSRQPWFQEWITAAGNWARATISKAPSTIKNNFDWIKRQVAESLVMYRRGLSTEAFLEWIDQMVFNTKIKPGSLRHSYILELQEKGWGALVHQ